MNEHCYQQRLHLKHLMSVKIVLLLLGLASADCAVAQAYSDCKEAGGFYADCQEPDIGPWTKYTIGGGTGMPNGSCPPNNFTTEAAAIECAKNAIANAQIGPSGWCAITWIEQSAPWTTWQAFNGWTIREQRTPSTFTWTGHDIYGKCVQSGVIGAFYIFRERAVRCPPGFVYWVPRSDGKNVCYRPSLMLENDQCTNPVKGNPVRITDRAKLQHEIDYAPTTNALLAFKRIYDSTFRTSSDSRYFGSHWRTNFDRSITLNTFVNPPVAVHRDADDNVNAFRKQGSIWMATGRSVGALAEILDGSGSRVGWIFTSPANESGGVQRQWTTAERDYGARAADLTGLLGLPENWPR